MTNQHPGHHIRVELQERGLTSTELALALRWAPSYMTGVLSGWVPIDQHSAYDLARFFGTSPAFWTTLQQRHDHEAQLMVSGKTSGVRQLCETIPDSEVGT